MCTLFSAIGNRERSTASSDRNSVSLTRQRCVIMNHATTISDLNAVRQAALNAPIIAQNKKAERLENARIKKIEMEARHEANTNKRLAAAALKEAILVEKKNKKRKSNEVETS